MTRSRGQPGYDRATLVDIATVEFHRRGYDATSMEDLAHAAGLSKASFYYHVVGKEELLRATVERGAQAVAAVLGDDGPWSVCGLVHRLAGIVRTDLPAVAVLVRARGNTSAERWVQATLDGFAAELAARLSASDSIDATSAAEVVVGLLHALVERSVLRERDPADLVDQLRRLINMG